MTDSKKQEVKPDTSKMEYRYLGNSGLRISVFGFGNSVNYRNDKLTVESLKIALSHGINYFDTAEIYGLGTGETNLGKAMKELGITRKKVVISTKIYKIGNDPNDGFLSRKHIIEGLKNSLQRLQLKYVDIIYCHRFDSYTPLEEICDTMNYVIEQGLAFYWATSGWSASQIMEAYNICDRLRLIRPIAEQVHYNIFTRSPVEDEYNDLIKKHKLGLIAYSPLEAGILTGKYINEVPKDSRANLNYDNANTLMEKYNKEKKSWDEKLLKLKDIAEKKIKCSLAQLCIAWIIANPDINSCILGASKPAQLEDNFKALEIYKKIDKDTFIEIEKIMDNAPKGEMDYLTWTQLPSRRNIAMNIDYQKH